jgi:hypothetical protein
MSEKLHSEQMNKLWQSIQDKAKNHTHCYHIYQESLMMVIPDGHVVQKCCKCECMQTVHQDHMWRKSKHSGCVSVEISW